MRQRIYLDHNATAPIRPEVARAVADALGRLVGNASSLHREGREARALLEDARERVAELLDAEPEEVVFTSGGTEANNLALRGLWYGTQPPALAVSAIEHPSVLEAARALTDQLHILPVTSDGVIQTDAGPLTELPQRALLAIMLANNETGILQPIHQLADRVRTHDWLLHVDAVQAVGKVPLRFRELPAATLSLSAHKFHGPPGIGALLVRRGITLARMLHGGEQEQGLRSGTEPVALAHGLAMALELACRALDAKTQHVAAMREALERGVLEVWPQAQVIGRQPPRVPNTTIIRFPGIDAQALILALDDLGVAASTGSACASGAPRPSHVLLAMGLSEAAARECVRFSLSEFTTAEEVKLAVERVRLALRRVHGG